MLTYADMCWLGQEREAVEAKSESAGEASRSVC
jgi:hypothetical protein